ncbi:VRR-NUC domain-containing protein [Chondrinema litorale]|uniref:VRR-NUC domain-containing protein n=1 Tax=Chondrinema litorale TaxID=2994555 RepID=UPI0025426B53|nr:VRR-NUC domain-containing protein [Chondrinema litorale]UZR94906.1 VRR-NUC domain-containing protein [Chondrinema litorale]
MDEDKKVLPEKYYHTYYHDLLAFIESKYQHLLSTAEKKFIVEFKKLDTDSQCLYLRLQNRKGKFFRFSKFSYPEISDIRKSLQILIKKGFSTVVDLEIYEEIAHVLNLYNRGELVELAQFFEIPKAGFSKLKKLELVNFLLKQIPLEELIACFQDDPVIVQKYAEEAQMIQFLYFGTTNLDMSQFVIRDLGNMRFEAINEELLSAGFETRKEAEDKLMLSLAYKFLREVRQEGDGEDFYNLISCWLENTPEISLAAQPLYDRLVLRSARFLEQQRLFDEALQIYEYTNKAPSRERRIRILHKRGEVEAALNLCNVIMDCPENADEKYFAKDFLTKLEGKKFIKSTRRFQKQSDTITISSSWQYQVEMGVLDYYMTEKKMQGFFSENFLWRALFGLFFWDIIFDEAATGFHNPFQRSPDDLFTSDFLIGRKEAIEEKLSLLKNKKQLFEQLTNTYNEKYGMASPVISWFEDLLPMLQIFISKVDTMALREVLISMCENLRDNSRGFPDLFIWDANTYLFVEVKSPNDTLSAQQLHWLELFNEVGINAQLMNVQWK